MITVTFVGAGSVEFTRNVVTDLCAYPEFRGRLRLTLYDISAERLEHAERLARRVRSRSLEPSPMALRRLFTQKVEWTVCAI